MGCYEDFMEFREEVERLKKNRLRKTATDVCEGSTAVVEIGESL